MPTKYSGSIPRSCKQCGEVFRTWPNRIRRGEGLFCSLSCCSKSKAVPPETRFWRHVTKGDSCWIWVGNLDRGGYGRLNIHGKFILAHRLSWELHNGPIPAGLLCLHKCDNPPCCKPEHLYLGTDKDNTRDKMARNRQGAPRGSNQPMAKLKEDDIPTIRRMIGEGIPCTQIARLYGVSNRPIYTIKHGTGWTHVLVVP